MSIALVDTNMSNNPPSSPPNNDDNDNKPSTTSSTSTYGNGPTRSIDDLFELIRQGLERQEAKKPPHERMRFSFQFSGAKKDAARANAAKDGGKDGNKGKQLLFGSQIRDALLNTSYKPPKPKPPPVKPMKFDAPTFKFGSPAASDTAAMKGDEKISASPDMAPNKSTDEHGICDQFPGEPSRSMPPLSSRILQEQGIFSKIASPQAAAAQAGTSQVQDDLKNEPKDVVAASAAASMKQLEDESNSRRSSKASFSSTRRITVGSVSSASQQRPSLSNFKSASQGSLFGPRSATNATAAAAQDPIGEQSFVDSTIMLSEPGYQSRPRRVNRHLSRGTSSNTISTHGTTNRSSMLSINSSISSVGMSSSFLLGGSFVNSYGLGEDAVMSSLLEEEPAGKQAGEKPGKTDEAEKTEEKATPSFGSAFGSSHDTSALSSFQEVLQQAPGQEDVTEKRKPSALFCSVTFDTKKRRMEKDVDEDEEEKMEDERIE